jgi:hypothetical protein
MGKCNGGASRKCAPEHASRVAERSGFVQSDQEPIRWDVSDAPFARRRWFGVHSASPRARSARVCFPLREAIPPPRAARDTPNPETSRRVPKWSSPPDLSALLPADPRRNGPRHRAGGRDNRPPSGVSRGRPGFGRSISKTIGRDPRRAAPVKPLDSARCRHAFTGVAGYIRVDGTPVHAPDCATGPRSRGTSRRVGRRPTRPNGR